MVFGQLFVLLAQETSPPSTLVIALSVVSFLLLLAVVYLLSTPLPLLKGRIREQNKALEEKDESLRVADFNAASQRKTFESEAQQLNQRIDQLKENLHGRADRESLARQVNDLKLALHVQRRLQTRIEETVHVESGAKQVALAEARQQDQRCAALERQVRDMDLDRHVQRRLQARLEESHRDSQLDLQVVVQHARHVESHVDFLAENAKRQRTRRAKIEKELERARRKARVLESSSMAHFAARQADRRTISNLRTRVGQLEGVARASGHGNGKAKLQMAERKLRNLRHFLAKR